MNDKVEKHVEVIWFYLIAAVALFFTYWWTSSKSEWPCFSQKEGVYLGIIIGTILGIIFSVFTVKCVKKYDGVIRLRTTAKTLVTGLISILIVLFAVAAIFWFYWRTSTELSLTFLIFNSVMFTLISFFLLGFLCCIYVRLLYGKTVYFPVTE